MRERVRLIKDGFQGQVLDCMGQNSHEMVVSVREQLYSGIDGEGNSLSPSYDSDPYFQDPHAGFYDEDRGHWMNCYRHPERYIAWKQRITPPETSPYLLSLRYMLRKNIVCGDALTYRTVENKPITFCEWTPIAGSMQFSRRDFQFDFLVTQSHQYSLFDEQGEAQSFDEPVHTYPPLHYTQLYRYDTL